MKRPDLTKIARKYGWKFLEYQSNIEMVSYIKIDNQIGRARINIYLTKMTVATVLDHPTKKRQQLFRKRVDEELMERLFINPRLHTGKGYYIK